MSHPLPTPRSLSLTNAASRGNQMVIRHRARLADAHNRTIGACIFCDSQACMGDCPAEEYAIAYQQALVDMDRTSRGYWPHASTCNCIECEVN